MSVVKLRKAILSAIPMQSAILERISTHVLGLIGLGWPHRGLWRWRGGWRIAAAPAMCMPFVVLRIVVDTARDPTPRNPWPFES